MGHARITDAGAGRPAGERYVLLALRLGRHVDGLVEVYTGPGALAAEAGLGPPIAPADLVEEADALLAELPDGWLRDQSAALRVVAGVLAGERPPYDAEVRGHFGVPCAHTDEADFEAAHQALDAILPGRGPVPSRHAAWRASLGVAPDRVPELIAAVIDTARRWTREVVALPEEEGVDVEMVRETPWLAFSEYRGGLRSHIMVNAGFPLSAIELLRLAMHETYPGHHAERAAKDHLLVRGRGLVEESLVLTMTPQSLISEGIAEAAPLAALEADCGADLEALLRAAGIPVDIRHAVAVERAAQPLRRAEVNAARMIHGAGAPRDAVIGYLRRWALAGPELAEHLAGFLGDPDSRTYAITYAAGAEACSAYLAGPPERLRRLLTEQVRVGDLVAGA